MIAYAIKFNDTNCECGKKVTDYFFSDNASQSSDYVFPWVKNMKDAAIFRTLKEAKLRKKRLYPKSRIVELCIGEL